LEFARQLLPEISISETAFRFGYGSTGGFPFQQFFAADNLEIACNFGGARSVEKDGKKVDTHVEDPIRSFWTIF